MFGNGERGRQDKRAELYNKKEDKRAINKLKLGKAVRTDEMRAEILSYGGEPVLRVTYVKLHGG